MIEAVNINKSFDEKQVLKNVSTAFEAGKTNLVIGQSGSGKTVLIKCLVGLFKIDGGKILYNDRDFSKMNFKKKRTIRKEIGMMFQGGALFDSLTVEENIVFPLNMFTNMTAKEKKAKADFCLERVNLDNVNEMLPSELSGGMQKRVAIARAISMDPKYLFCDEPNSGLDPKTSLVIDQLIHDITIDFNMTTVINTHDMNSVFAIGDNIAFIYQGQLWWEGKKEDIIQSGNKELNEFVFSTEVMKRLRGDKQDT